MRARGERRTRHGAALRTAPPGGDSTTPLYRLIATNLETFLAEVRAAHDRGVPRYVERELRAYLACGIHAHGFCALGAPLAARKRSWRFRVSYVASALRATRAACAALPHIIARVTRPLH